MKKLNCKVMFDNGGGISVDFNGWKHYYNECNKASKDYLEFVQNGNTDEWEGHDEEVEITDGICTNGGHKTVGIDEIEEMVKNDSGEYWGLNEEEFINSIINLTAK